MRADVRGRVQTALGSELRSIRPVSGGDINEAYAVTLTDGSSVFVKTNANPPPGMFESEARGLEWLRAAGAVRIPEVIAIESDALVLEWIESARHASTFDEDFGRALARLHASGAPGFGLDHDNYVGRIAQPNETLPNWPEFYGERRLAPLLRRARDAGELDASAARSGDALVAKLAEIAGPAEPSARLHGDLWGGNLHVDERGAPVLIDPAVYGGHREIDLAMMRLFGGFSARVFEAYDEAFPLAPGFEERVPLYQLYPLLVHVALFGGGYAGQAIRAIGRYT